MFALYKLIGSFVTLPGILILLVFIAFILSIRDKKIPRKYKIFFGCIAFCLYIMSTSFLPSLLMRLISNDHNNRSLPPANEPALFLVLGAGHYYNSDGAAIEPNSTACSRIVTALRAIKGRSTENTYVTFTGGESFDELDNASKPKLTMAECAAAAARDIGFNGKIMLEAKSRTTAEDFKNIRLMLNSLGIKNLCIVTSATHMKRALLVAKHFLPEFTIFTYPASLPIKYQLQFDAFSFMPSGGNFELTCGATRELVGLVAYKLFFWLKG